VDQDNKINHKIHVELFVTEDKRSAALGEFNNHLDNMLPKIKKKKEKKDHLPYIQIKNIKYQMIPTGRELEIFLKLLTDPKQPISESLSSVQNDLKKIKIPAPIKIYILPTCPHCPTAVSQVLSLAQASIYINPVIIDGNLFPELIEADDVKSVPTIILDTRFRWNGTVQPKEFVNTIINRDPSQLSTATLKSMIEDGKAVTLARMMIENDIIFPAFPELLIHSKWPIRLGAMVVYETITDENIELAAGVIPYLWEKFDNTDDTDNQVKGDILYLMGISGKTDTALKIKSVLKKGYSKEINEAAEDALLMLNKQTKLP